MQLLRQVRCALCTAAVLCLFGGLSAAAAELTLEQALARARERAPRLLAAQARVQEADGRLVGAQALFAENPVVETSSGRRRRDDGGTGRDTAVGIHQGFELGGQRGARIEAAQAGVAHAIADQGDALRALLRDVAVAFLRTLHAAERVRLAGRAEDVTAQIAAVAERRYAASDVPILDVNLSRVALARARSERLAAEAEEQAALGELRVLLDLDPAELLAVRGELRSRPRLELAALRESASRRADLEARAAELREAEAELRLAQGEAWPDVGLGARYERDDRDDVVSGELTFTLPVFERGQGARAEARARARRLRLELDTGRRAVDSELRAAFAVYTQREAAVAELEARALPLLDENEALARRSYEAGQIGLADLLLVRRELLDTRSDYLERLLEAGVAAADLQASAGVLP
jgi:outer membrane protein, heavy metal efflux system